MVAGESVTEAEVDAVVDDPDFRLRWHPKLLLAEAEAVERRFSYPSPDWTDAWELLLAEAFSSSVPAERFVQTPSAISVAFGARMSGSVTQRHFTAVLMAAAPRLDEPGAVKALWSERTSPEATSEASRTRVWARRQFSVLLHELEGRGYFKHATGEECVDGDVEAVPLSAVVADVLRRELPQGKPEAWSDADFFDLIEALHQIVERPATRSFHSYSGCGWHHSNFSRASGQRVYRFFVNQLLDASEIPYRIAVKGADVGCVVARGSKAHQSAVDRVLSRGPGDEQEERRHAIQLYRGRGSTLEERRSAVFAFGRLLEKRRETIHAVLTKRGAAPLFEMLNKWNIRHNRADQIRDYDPAFLDWLFLNCLATLDLFDAIEETPAGRSRTAG